MSSNTFPTKHFALLIASLVAIGMGQSMTFAILAPLGRQVEMSELAITTLIACSSLTFGFASPYWGRLSDRIGRRPVILIGLVGYCFGTTAFASIFILGINGTLSGAGLFASLLVARCLHAAIMSATGPSTTAYAADHTTPEKRTKTMAKLGTATSMGMILGPAFAGATATFGLMAPLYAAAVSATASVTTTLLAAAQVGWWAPRRRWRQPTTRFADDGLKVVDARASEAHRSIDAMATQTEPPSTPAPQSCH